MNQNEAQKTIENLLIAKNANWSSGVSSHLKHNDSSAHRFYKYLEKNYREGIFINPVTENEVEMEINLLIRKTIVLLAMVFLQQ